MQICTHCQRENTDDSRFCVACGSALQASANEAQPVSDTPTIPKVQAYVATGGQNLWETNKQEARKQIKKLEITKRLKARWWSIPYLLSGIISFACGIKAVNEWCIIYDETAEFGADFYTYLYRVVRSMAGGLEDIGEFLFFGIGSFLIVFGLYLICKFIEKFFRGKVDEEN